jgi:hypothetical protein
MAGLLAQLGAAQESTYGTGVTPSRFWDFNSESLALDIKRADSNAYRSASRVRRSGRTVSNRLGATGSVSLDVGTKGMAWLSQLALGAGAVTTPGGATLTRDSTITMSDTPPSATIQVGRPDAFNVSRPYTYLGCMVTDWEYACAVSGLLTLNLGIDAQDETIATGLATPSYATGATLLWTTRAAPSRSPARRTRSRRSGQGHQRALRNGWYTVRGSGVKSKPTVAGLREPQVDVHDRERRPRRAPGVHRRHADDVLRGVHRSADRGRILVRLHDLSARRCYIDQATPVVKGTMDVVSIDVTATILHDPTPVARVPMIRALTIRAPRSVDGDLSSGNRSRRLPDGHRRVRVRATPGRRSRRSIVHRHHRLRPELPDEVAAAATSCSHTAPAPRRSS